MKLKIGRAAAILLAAEVIFAAGCGSAGGIVPGRFWNRIGRLPGGEDARASSASQETSAPDGNEESGTAEKQEESTGTESAATADSSGYLYDTLTDTEKQTYSEMFAGIMAHEEDALIHAENTDELSLVLQACLSDHPEIFWMDGAATFTSYGIGSVYNVHFDFNIPADEIESTASRIEAAADEYLAQIPDGAGDYDKARIAYEYIVNNTEYVSGSAQNQNIQSVFLYHESVCAGYAKAYKYLLDRAGVWCAYISGTIESSGVTHAWNLIRIGDTYTYVDPSWGDPTYGENAEDSARLNIIYDYFCLTSAEMTRSGHVAGDRFPAVSADANEYDYYRLNGEMYDSAGWSDIAEIFQNAVDAGSNIVYMKFTSFDAYAQALSLIGSGDESPIREPLQEKMRRDGTNAMQYYTSKSDELWIIKVYW